VGSRRHGDLSSRPRWAQSDAQVMLDARAKVLAACKANKLFFLNTVTPDNVVDMIKEGVRVGAAAQNGEKAADIGRKYTKRQMPW